jgi:hypothetical protein
MAILGNRDPWCKKKPARVAGVEARLESRPERLVDRRIDPAAAGERPPLGLVLIDLRFSTKHVLILT